MASVEILRKRIDQMLAATERQQQAARPRVLFFMPIEDREPLEDGYEHEQDAPREIDYGTYRVIFYEYEPDEDREAS